MKSYYLAKQSCALIASFSLTCNLHAAVVFQTGFDYANTPTLTTGGASVNGATGQIGSFSGTMNGPTLTSGGALQMDGRGAGRGTGWTLRSTFSETIAFAGSTITFDYGTRRTTNDHLKDNFIIGYDSNDIEVFRLVVSTDFSTTGENRRLGIVDGFGTINWDLGTTVGNDADDDIFAAVLEPSVTISMALSAAGFTLSLDGDNDYTTSEISFNGGTELAYLEFTGQSATPSDNATDGGMILDNISVISVSEPPYAALLSLGGLTLILNPRK